MKTTQRASTLVNRSQVAQDTAHTTQGTERAHRRTGAKWPRTRHSEDNAPGGHTGNQELSGPGHCTRKTTHGADTPVIRSQVDHDTAHTRQCTKRAHGCTGAKCPRTPHTQHNTQSKHTGEQEPSGQGHRTRNATHRVGTLVNKGQVTQDTAQVTQQLGRTHR